MNIYILLEIIDMNNIDNPKVELYFNRGLYSYYCTFNLKKEFILCGNIYDKDAIKKDIYDDKKIDRYVWIYSTQTENNKWMCKGIYKIPKDFELISKHIATHGMKDRGKLLEVLI